MVEIETGLIAGTTAAGVESFKGIPYAAPPVGDLRWRAPQPARPWAGVRDATDFGSDCVQVPVDFEPIQTSPAEDSLFLNVWRPAKATPGDDLPVLVWIHGGGFVGGGSSIPTYDGSAFARRGIVVVSLNYRLGRLGFFAHPAILAAGETPTGNFGLMDQIAALRWVQRNIAAFGGDPRQVTIAGESAGGASVLLLLTSPATAGLFHRAVIMSGGGREALVTRPMTSGTRQHPSADRTDEHYARSQGIRGDGPDALAALRALPAADIIGDLTLAAMAPAVLLGRRDRPGMPMIDGELVTGPPGPILTRGEAARVPVLVGTCAMDIPVTLPPSKLRPFAHFGGDAARARAAYGAPSLLNLKAHFTAVLAMGTDMSMHEPARFVARQVTANGDSAFLYRFTYTAESTRPASLALGQTHAGELPFMFDTLDDKYGDDVTGNDRQTARQFNAFVANFVRSGDPNGDDLPDWPAFDPGHYDLLDFTFDDGPVYRRDPRAEQIELVERAADGQG